MNEGASTFRVDLGGLVEVLSKHLYSSPHVYLRELVQNAVDAITARSVDEPNAPRRIDITPADVSPDGALHVDDTGVGLDLEGITTFLSTIGASAKRDELGFAREDFLGQFGIGLLSCFLVTDDIVVTTRCNDGPTLRWHGRSDGTYEVSEHSATRPEPGTSVVLVPRPGDRTLLESARVLDLARQFAEYLPVALTVATPSGHVEVAGRPFPWEEGGGDSDDVFGFAALDTIPLQDPAAGLRGVAWVLPTGGGGRGHHRVYAKRMLVGNTSTGVLPSWAFFVRAMVDTDQLSLTASREALHVDDLLEETRERLGDQIRAWLVRLVRQEPQRARTFLDEHYLAVKAMAAFDDQMLTIVADLLEWETTTGRLSLRDLAATERVLTYVTSVDDYRQVASLAQGLTVLNAGYAYDERILTRWLARHRGIEGRHLSPSDLTADFVEPDEDEARTFVSLLDVAASALARSGSRTELRAFQPSRVQAVLLSSRAAHQQLDRATVLEQSTGPWAAALSTQNRPDDRPAFVLNAANPVVLRLAGTKDPGVQRAAVEALYAQALFAGQHPLRPFDSALVARALPTLIDLAIDASEGDHA